MKIFKYTYYTIETPEDEFKDRDLGEGVTQQAFILAMCEKYGLPTDQVKMYNNSKWLNMTSNDMVLEATVLEDPEEL